MEIIARIVNDNSPAHFEDESVGDFENVAKKNDYKDYIHREEKLRFMLITTH